MANFIILTVVSDETDRLSMDVGSDKVYANADRVTCFVAHREFGSHVTLDHANQSFWVKESPGDIWAMMRPSR